MSKELQALGEKITESIIKIKGNGDILGVIYNPFKEEGMKNQDVKFLLYLLENVQFRYPTLILHGPGGDFTPSIQMPRILEKHLRKYKVYIPRICCSGLCYSFFRAKELILTENSKITQIDPKFPYNGEDLRAINHLKSIDPKLKKQARQIYDLAQKQIEALSKPPSIFQYKLMDYNEYAHRQSIIDCFLNKENHETPLTWKELKELEIKIVIDKDKENQKIADELIQICQEFMDITNTRVMFISSIPFKINNKKGEGVYLCPLS